MRIDIQIEHSLVPPQEIDDGNSRVVEDTEPAGAPGHGVMQAPGGVHCPRRLPTADEARRLQRRPCIEQGRLQHPGERDVIQGPEAILLSLRHAPAGAERRHRVVVFPSVDRQHLLFGGRLCLHLADMGAVEHPLGLEPLAQDAQALRA